MSINMRIIIIARITHAHVRKLYLNYYKLKSLETHRACNYFRMMNQFLPANERICVRDKHHVRLFSQGISFLHTLLIYNNLLSRF